MASPLSPRSNSAINTITTPKSTNSKLRSPSPSKLRPIDENKSVATSTSSSPFETDVMTDVGQENIPVPGQSISPLKHRSGSKQTKSQDCAVLDEDDTVQPPLLPLRISPMKTKEDSGSNCSVSKHTKNQNSAVFDEDATAQPPLPPFRISPKKSKEDSGSNHSVSPAKIPLPSSSPSRDPDDVDFLSDTPVSRRAEFQRNASPTSKHDLDMDTRSVVSDDTNFSAFSAVPTADMTLFARLGNRTADSTFKSPTKRSEATKAPTPSAPQFMTPATSRRQNPASRVSPSRAESPTPRGNKTLTGDGDTTNLLDFTQQFEPGSRTRQSPVKYSTEPNLLAHLNNQRIPSPSKAPRSPGTRRSLLNLLDFDLPPQPTPRSVPSISVRELETLKSNYLSEISSLKASLSGRDAEVSSLKRAVGDAERRVGEAQESVREERSAREHAESSKADWEKKGKEVENVLESVREEFVEGEREKDELQQKLEEANKALHEAELKAAHSATKAGVAQSECNDDATLPTGDQAVIAAKVQDQLDERLENLARELHGVYKKKHETKITTLKKNYETRLEKNNKELQKKIDELTKQNDELQAIKESSLSLELPASKSNDAKVNEQIKAEIEEQRARIAGLQQEMNTVQESHAQIMKELEAERVEKGELVAAVDEMLALQGEAAAQPAVEEFRKSISRPSSGLKAPGAGLGESRIGRGPGLPTRSISSGGKSRMMSNIEQMGKSGGM
ncbi:MAG: hypothetical protein M1831_007527 [Alyxoria varia]|nr:MAG: hypothetical protein M1831_007527 [Alyxoria varia]